jgi:hypothetical protein
VGMMTDEQILKIASENLYCNMSVIEWSGRNEDILKFARELYNEGYVDGYNKGYDIGTLDMEDENV